MPKPNWTMIISLLIVAIIIGLVKTFIAKEVLEFSDGSYAVKKIKFGGLGGSTAGD